MLEDKQIQLYCGDCLDIMEQIPDHSIDMILTDLPYAITKCSWDILIPLNDYVVYDKKILNENEFYIYMIENGFKDIDYIKKYFNENVRKGLWSHYKRVAKENAAIVLFGQEPFSSFLRNSNLENYRYDIYWEKERLTNINQVKRRVGKTIETISIFYKKQCTYNPQMIKYDGPLRTNKVKNGKMGKLTDYNEKNVFEYKDTGWRYPTQVWRYKRDCLTSNLHPTQKPLLLCEDLIKTFSNENDIIFDSCMGSGTTGVACVNTNRRFIGIEKDKEFFNISKGRILE